MKELYKSIKYYLNEFFPFISFDGEIEGKCLTFSSNDYEIIIIYLGEEHNYGVTIKEKGNLIYGNLLPDPEIIKGITDKLATVPAIKASNRNYFINQVLDK